MLRTFFTFLFVFAAASAQAEGFKFSDDDKADESAQTHRQARVQSLLQTPCLRKIKNQKIMVLIGETRNGAIRANQGSYGPHVDAINTRLQSLGLKTYTASQIRQQVAQAEIDAYFKNDPDAAISASKRLAAQYILRGLIATHVSHNAAINVNQVNISMDFALAGANGRMISQTRADNASYAGQDTAGMALTLINERADELVAKLYSDYCGQTGAR